MKDKITAEDAKQFSPEQLEEWMNAGLPGLSIPEGQDLPCHSISVHEINLRDIFPEGIPDHLQKEYGLKYSECTR